MVLGRTCPKRDHADEQRQKHREPRGFPVSKHHRHPCFLSQSFDNERVHDRNHNFSLSAPFQRTPDALGPRVVPRLGSTSQPAPPKSG
jgi:hypothetical protein